MCLNVKNNWKRNEFNKPIPRKAEKDIVCYKWLEREHSKILITPFWSTVVKIGQKMEAGLGIGYYSVNEGIHAFTTKKKAFTNFQTEDVIVECIIPKGAEYIRGMDDDIVATEMKLQRIIMDGGKLKKKKV